MPQKGWVSSQKVQNGCRGVTRELWSKKRIYMPFMRGVTSVKIPLVATEKSDRAHNENGYESTMVTNRPNDRKRAIAYEIVVMGAKVM